MWAVMILAYFVSLGLAYKLYPYGEAFRDRGLVVAPGVAAVFFFTIPLWAPSMEGWEILVLIIGGSVQAGVALYMHRELKRDA